MPNLRTIRRQIISVKNIQQVTRAMYMVAAAKMRRAQEAILQTRPYAQKLSELTAHLASQIDQSKHPLLEVREIDRRLVVVVSADRGLCGSFNSNVIRRGSRYLKEHDGSVDLAAIGQKALKAYSRREGGIAHQYVGIFKDLHYLTAQSIAKELTSRFRHGDADRIDIIYNEFKSALEQNVVLETFLPLDPKEPEGDTYFTDYIYEPSQEILWDRLVERQLAMQIWRILLESNAAEQASRMTAMDNATGNASDMIQELTRLRNKVRQASITQEISEIVGGSEAL